MLYTHKLYILGLMLKVARVLVMLWCFSGVATAAQFAFGASLGGIGKFDGGAFGTGLPGAVLLAARVEWLNGFAPGLSLRVEGGNAGFNISAVFRLDLSQNINVLFGIGYGLFEQADLGFVGRLGFEYRFSGFGLALEYGLISSFAGQPGLRSNLMFSVLWFGN